MEVEKNWLLKDMVWVVHKGGFSAAHLVKTGPAPQEGKLFVKLEFTQDIIEVNEEDVEKVFDYFILNLTFLSITSIYAQHCLVVYSVQVGTCNIANYTYLQNS